jgi:hypothetical protein
MCFAFVLMLTVFHHPQAKSSASAQRQAAYKGKISGFCNFYGRCNYRYSIHQWSWDLMSKFLKKLLNSMLRRLQDVIRREGTPAKY